MPNPRAKPRTGTLRLLVNLVRPDDNIGFGQPLSWSDYPPDACWQDTLDDLELGDYDCDPVPELPEPGRGLWLLEWSWREVQVPDEPGVLTAKYADTGAWRRPTMADLVALGVLPEVPRG